MTVIVDDARIRRKRINMSSDSGSRACGHLLLRLGTKYKSTPKYMYSGTPAGVQIFALYFGTRGFLIFAQFCNISICELLFLFLE